MDRMEDINTLLDAERRRLARAYNRVRRRWSLLSLFVGPVYLVLWVSTGAFLRLGEWVTHQVSWFWAQVALVLLIVGGGAWLLDTVFALPGYILARRYGLSTQSPEDWLTDQVKAGLVVGVIGLVAVEGIYVLLRVGSPVWWVWAAVGLVLLVAFLTLVAPVVIAPLFFTFTPLENPVLEERLLCLAQEAGVQATGVYRFDMSRRTQAANAAIIGLGRTRRIVVADTLLDPFPPAEVEVIFAHELAHHVHRDMALGLVITGVMGFVGFWVLDRVLQWATEQWHLPMPAMPHTVPLILLTFVLYGLIVSPLLNLWSRSRETLADLFAIALTGRGTTYARAMARLADQNLADLWPPRWYVWLFGTHPPTGERLMLALEFGDEEGNDTLPPHPSPQEA